MKEYRKDLDILKGISIIAVILYHVGILKSGYLGVDIFFLINGFLVIPSIYQKIKNGNFHYFEFIKKKYCRLGPLIIILSMICFFIGCIGMLPDDNENLIESIIASLAFSQNILSLVTTKDYWNVVNEYKPMMHLWYIGILMEFYLLIPLVIYLFKHISKILKKNFEKVYSTGLIFMTIVSLILFFMPNFSNGSKFYLIFFRIWELLLGGIISIYITKIKIRSKKIIKIGCLVLICLLLIIGIFNTNYSTLWQDKVVPIGSKDSYNSNLIIPNSLAILLTLIFTSGYIIIKDVNISNKLIEYLGKSSYSIFVWHQPILSFYRYFIKYELSTLGVISYLLLVFIISYISYKFIEKKVVYTRKKFAFYIISTVFILTCSLNIFLKAGVIRDVPELDINKDNAHYNMHAEYCDRVYEYDNDFEKNNKMNILIIGNSFARDFANILLESNLKDKINLSYLFSLDESHINRIKESDYVFYFGYKEDLPKYFWSNIQKVNNVYGIGTKNFGESNGIIYAKRFKDNYFKQTVILNEKYRELNEELKESWKENYIDLISCITVDGNSIRVFTEDNKFISQDCRHLTKAGAKYYSRILKFEYLEK